VSIEVQVVRNLGEPLPLLPLRLFAPSVVRQHVQPLLPLKLFAPSVVRQHVQPLLPLKLFAPSVVRQHVQPLLPLKLFAPSVVRQHVHSRIFHASCQTGALYRTSGKVQGQSAAFSGRPHRATHLVKNEGRRLQRWTALGAASYTNCEKKSADD
jgi:hypothetical protein